MGFTVRCWGRKQLAAEVYIPLCPWILLSCGITSNPDLTTVSSVSTFYESSSGVPIIPTRLVHIASLSLLVIPTDLVDIFSLSLPFTPWNESSFAVKSRMSSVFRSTTSRVGPLMAERFIRDKQTKTTSTSPAREDVSYAPALADYQKEHDQYRHFLVIGGNPNPPRPSLVGQDMRKWDEMWNNAARNPPGNGGMFPAAPLEDCRRPVADETAPYFREAQDLKQAVPSGKRESVTRFAPHRTRPGTLG